MSEVPATDQYQAAEPGPSIRRLSMVFRERAQEVRCPCTGAGSAYLATWPESGRRCLL